MIKLYGLPLSFPVNRVRICLNAMQLDYEFIEISPLSGETQSEEYLALNPSGKIPAIEVDGFGLFESNTIMRYLARKYDSPFYPNDIEGQAHVDKWLDFVGNHLGAGIAKALFNKVFASMFEMDVDEQSMKDGYAFIERFLGVIDGQLSKNSYLAGNNMSIADFCLLATADPVDVLGVDMTQYPAVSVWRQKMMAKSFYTDMHRSFNDVLEAMKAAQ